MTPPLAAFQDALAAALSPGEPHASLPGWLASLAAQPGFAVYRNTVAQGCLSALRANYPTVRQLLGDDCFDAMALDFAHREPPEDALLMLYGADLAEHLARWRPVADLPYLPDVARLDRLWSESHVAADAPVANTAWLAALAPDELAAQRLCPHPAARWLWCDAHPAYTIWRRHRESLPLDASFPWCSEGALLTRPSASVHWHALDAPGHAFLGHCARHLPLAEAAAATLHVYPRARLDVLLAQLLNAGALTSCTTV